MYLLNLVVTMTVDVILTHYHTLLLVFKYYHLYIHPNWYIWQWKWPSVLFCLAESLQRYLRSR